MIWPLLALVACSEYRVGDPDRTPPAQPPEEADGQGRPPDNWIECSSGFLGSYYNLPAQHADVGAEAPVAPEAPEGVDWWEEDYLSFSRYDATIDFGENWWPVDEGLAGDPDYFTTSWSGWLRIWSRTNLRVLLGAADDAWVTVDGEVVATVLDADTLEPQAVDIDLNQPGQVPIQVHYAHRHAAAAGFRFRILSGDVSLCYPEFDDE